MDIQEFIGYFAAQFDETDASEFQPDTHFQDLEEWNSFLALAVMAMIKSEYDVAVTAQEMRDAKTVQNLYAIVKSHIEQ